MIDIENWKFINTFAPWLSAIGTFSAVIVSLYLAKLEKPLRLKIQAETRTIIDSNNEEYLMIEVINIGSRKANITGLGWTLGIFVKKSFIQIVKEDYRDLYSSPLPISLMDGEEARWLVPLKEKKWLINFSTELGFFPRWSLYWMRLEVFTSNGGKFTTKIGKGLKQALLEEIKRTKD